MWPRPCLARFKGRWAHTTVSLNIFHLKWNEGEGGMIEYRKNNRNYQVMLVCEWCSVCWNTRFRRVVWVVAPLILRLFHLIVKHWWWSVLEYFFHPNLKYYSHQVSMGRTVPACSVRETNASGLVPEENRGEAWEYWSAKGFWQVRHMNWSAARTAFSRSGRSWRHGRTAVCIWVRWVVLCSLISKRRLRHQW